ncbi:MAG: hypothetical protein EXR79_12780 [Myxococcales bacterium]|nr:hypothetical protein [Myxococcales bacterium]
MNTPLLRVASLLPLAALTASCGTLQQLYASDDAMVAVAALSKGAVAAGGAAMPIGYEEELSYGGGIAVQIMARYGGLYEEPKARAYVTLVGETVAMYSGRPDIEYHFAILDSDEVQALSGPGGYVFVTRGALAKMNDEAELAGVLAHEVAHIVAKHALDIIRKLKTQQAVTSAAADAWKEAALFKGFLDGFLGEYLEKGLPRDTEFESDKLSTASLAQIGWRPAGLRDFLARLVQAEKTAEGNSFARTHPKSEERIAALDAQLAALPKDGAGNVERFQTALAAVLPKGTAPAVAPDAGHPVTLDPNARPVAPTRPQ